MFSRISNLDLLRQRLDRDAKSLQITLNSTLHCAISHSAHVAKLCSFHFGFNSRFHFKVIFHHVFALLFFLTCFKDKKGPPTMNEFAVIFRPKTTWQQLLTNINVSLELFPKSSHGLISGTM